MKSACLLVTTVVTTLFIKVLYHMTRTATRVISLETHIRKKVPYEDRARQSDRSGKKRTSLLEMRTALLETLRQNRCELMTKTVIAAKCFLLKMSDESEHFVSEFSRSGRTDLEPNTFPSGPPTQPISTYYYTTQALRGPITKLNESKCSIAGPIFSKYWTGHCPE